MNMHMLNKFRIKLTLLLTQLFLYLLLSSHTHQLNVILKCHTSASAALSFRNQALTQDIS